MSPTMQKILDKACLRIYNGDYDKNHEETVRETLKDFMVECEQERMCTVLTKLDEIIKYVGTGIQGRIDARETIVNMVDGIREYIIYSEGKQDSLDLPIN